MFLIMLMLFVVAFAIILAGLILSLRSQASADEVYSVRPPLREQRRSADAYRFQDRRYRSQYKTQHSQYKGNRSYASVNTANARALRVRDMEMDYGDYDRQGMGNFVSALFNLKQLYSRRQGQPTPWLGLFLVLIALFGIGLFTMRPVFNNASVMPLFGINAPATTSQPAKTTTSQPAQPQFVGVVGASKALIRIGQLNHDQYNSTSEYNTWSDSVCSSAAMTEVINAYTPGHPYRVTDILKVESNLHQITPEDGLLSPNGIDITVASFGFNATHLSNPSLDQVISIANNGRPVIVSFPPGTWSSGGHILVVRGGNSSEVYLADSSIFNMTTMPRSTFMSYWRGFAVVVTPKAK
jgi:hypothetical protein